MAATALAACSSGAVEKARNMSAVSEGDGNGADAAAAATITNLTVENERLRRELGEAKQSRPTVTKRAAVEAERDAPAESAPAPRVKLAMCYKDYCPCDAPQEGMDSILCDQLEEGIKPDIHLMIAGRGGREYRRQARELGY